MDDHHLLIHKLKADHVSLSQIPSHPFYMLARMVVAKRIRGHHGTQSTSDPCSSTTIILPNIHLATSPTFLTTSPVFASHLLALGTVNHQTTQPNQPNPNPNPTKPKPKPNHPQPPNPKPIHRHPVLSGRPPKELIQGWTASDAVMGLVEAWLVDAGWWVG